MLYDLTPFQDYLQTERPRELAHALDEAMYDIILNAEQVGTTEGISQRYYTLRQLRDIIKNLNQVQ
jgi:hypothetical protein